ncbi:ABC transporter ATP-binding protein [Aureimonas endophytica]|uniref:ABC transporter ATP-binding protein n=1 Tax=Aureimonas endophytica TaxID=2027858 RepID=A0A916ZID8_9HYPH|nr:ABC transporter ATP-binding protein [Aureimonas endophytica]GGD98024.1 ABC transporter ATP-binding protein [Aureimonas endophytica]
MSVEFQTLSRSYKGKPALDGFDLKVEPQSFTVLCGPPASGKSVLFRLLVGLEKPDAGRILLSGRDITATPPAERPVGYVPQSFALYPHLTVADNMAYPMRLAGAPREAIARRVDRTAGILSITHLLKKTPDQLSGGEKQRVAVARGLLKDAEIFVLDDPLVGLDYKLRERLMDELKALRAELKATFLYATSDSLEALTMAQRLVVIDRGRVVQHAEAAEVYHDPRHARALDLVGFPHANLLSGRVANGMLEAGPLRCAVAARDGEVIAGLRPEAIRLGAAPGLRIEAQVRLVENLGGEAVIYLEAAGRDLTATLPISGGRPPEIGSRTALAVDPADILLFDAATEIRLAGSAA